MNAMIQPGGFRFRLLDLAAVVVGYGLASLLIRAFWPSGEGPPPADLAAIVVAYLWLGLAMSGPLVLLVRRPGHARPEPESRGAPGSPEPARRGTARTWAEHAWLVIGFYWIGLTILVVPARLNRSPLREATLLGVFPVAAALSLRYLSRSPRRPRLNREADPTALSPPGALADESGPAWTHHAAVGLLLSWPLAWIALILLGKDLF